MGGNDDGAPIKVTLTYLFLFIFFGGLYFAWGLALGKAGGYAYLNAALNADHERVISDLTDINAYHGRTDVHPLFVLILNPVGALITKGLGSRLAAAVLMNSVAGALCVVMTKAFLRRAGLSEIVAVLFAAILGLSATHIFFGSTPETWIFAAAGVILLFNLAVFTPGSTARFLPAAVFAFGTVTSNLVTAAVAYAVGMYKKIGFKALLAKTAVFSVSVAACAAALSVVQKLLYPRSTIFFLPEVYRLEFSSYSPIVRYFNDLSATYLLARLVKLAGVFLLYNLVAPATVVRWYSAGEFCLPLKPFVDVDLPRLKPLGFIAAAFWFGLVIWAAYSFIKNKEIRTPILFGLLLTLAFSVAFYFFYGTTTYVYAISTAFPLLAAVALALRPYDRPGTRPFYVLLAALTCFGFLLLFNNVAFLYRIYAVFREYPFPVSP
jgi:hypothetical protein